MHQTNEVTSQEASLAPARPKQIVTAQNLFFNTDIKKVVDFINVAIVGQGRNE